MYSRIDAVQRQGATGIGLEAELAASAGKDRVGPIAAQQTVLEVGEGERHPTHIVGNIIKE